jgi:hypothetical protein
MMTWNFWCKITSKVIASEMSLEIIEFGAGKYIEVWLYNKRISLKAAMIKMKFWL